jgi:hypothetical protein
MNAGLQMLRSVPEFRNILNSVAQAQVILKAIQQNNPHKTVATNLKTVIQDLEIKDVTPKMFVAMFLNANPEFQPFGTQQDSDEFTQKVLQTISNISPEF